jgi:TonB family protein
MRSYLFLVAFGQALMTSLTYASYLGSRESDLDSAVIVLKEGSLPQEMCDKCESGVFFLYMKIGMDGKPVDVKVIGTDNESLELGAIETGRAFSFNPPTEDGEPVEASVILILNIMNVSDSIVRGERCKLEYSLASGLEEIDGFEPPEMLTRFMPNYPVIAEQMGIEGRVVIETFIDIEGRLTRVVIRKSADKSFEEAVLYAVDRCRFRPAHYKGRPIGLYIRLPFRFTFQQRRGLVEHFDYGYGLR